MRSTSNAWPKPSARAAQGKGWTQAGKAQQVPSSSETLIRDLLIELARKLDYPRADRERKASLMWQRKSSRARRDPKRWGRCQAANPFWTLEELRGLHHPPFVADPEFTPFDIDALEAPPQSVPARGRPSKRGRLYSVRRAFPIPHLVAGLPWRFVPHLKGPVVPETDLVPLNLSYIS